MTNSDEIMSRAFRSKYNLSKRNKWLPLVRIKINGTVIKALSEISLSKPLFKKINKDRLNICAPELAS